MGPLFDFDEIVRIHNGTRASTELRDGELGVILGRGESDDGEWGYAVWVYRLGLVYDREESDLEATGEREPDGWRRKGATVRVRVDKNGTGYIVDSDE